MLVVHVFYRSARSHAHAVGARLSATVRTWAREHPGERSQVARRVSEAGQPTIKDPVDYARVDGILIHQDTTSTRAYPMATNKKNKVDLQTAERTA